MSQVRQANSLLKEDVYNEILLEHNLYPWNRGKLKECEIEKELKNASCGDRIFIQLKMRDGRIMDGKFDGIGCAISLAAADLMIETVRGKTLEEARVLGELFRKMILSSEDFEKNKKGEELGLSLALKEVARMPARAKCAELAWQVFESEG